MKLFLRMKIRNAILLFVLMTGSVSLMAQDVIIDGTITEVSTGMTIIGATVVQKGTTNGTVSDINGKYKLTVPKESVIVFSFVGYQKKEITAKDAGTINVAL